MITLISFAEGWGEASFSPFCTKAMYLLNMAGVDWTRENVSDPRAYPQQKLPALRIAESIIGDSDNIRLYLAEIGHDVDAHLSPEQRAEGIAWTRLAEEHLYYHQVMDRWLNPEVWPDLKHDYFSDMPFPVRHIVPFVLRRKMQAGLKFLGHSRQSPDMRMMRMTQDLDAVKTRLAGRAFLFGDAPSSADASLAAVLGGMRSGPVATQQATLIKEGTILSAYVDRMAETVGTNAAAA